MGTVVHIHRKSGQEPPDLPKWRRSSSLCLTADEKRHLSISLRNLRGAFGSWARLAAAMGVRAKTLEEVASGRGGSAAIALAAARAGNTTVEAVLTGQLTDAGRCPSCGSTLTERAAGGGR